MVSIQVKVQEQEMECDTCGDVAVTEFVGGGGSVYPLCGRCDIDNREAIAQRVDDAHQWRLSLGLHETCGECGAEAVTEFVGGGGSVYPLCEGCDDRLRETLAGAYDPEPEVHGACDDCGLEVASRRFLHLDGREFVLCEGCYTCAHHEPGYLVFCECDVPRCGADGTHCAQCDLEIRSWEEPEQRQYDWGEEEEGDFPAEESESEDDYDDDDAWATDDWCADSV